MKLLPTTLLTLCAALFTTSAYAGIDAGRDSATYYKTFPEKWDGQDVSVDCVSVTRINGGPQVEGLVFFSAQTIDEKNNTPGGKIVVAVLDDDVEALVRKYGTVIERTPGGSEKVDNKRLTGSFHQLEHGHVYIDESGDAHALILAHVEDAIGAIRYADGVPTADAALRHPRK